MSRAVLSLGSNLGDRLGFLQFAVTGLADVLVAVSSVYETTPWGVLDQDDFLNAVVIVEDEHINSRGWLDRAQQLESQSGRVRDFRWGPRTLDVDVVTVAGVRSDDPELTLPHPGAYDRATVLVPWLDVEPDAVMDDRIPISDLVAALDTTGVQRRDDLALEWREVHKSN